MSNGEGLAGRSYFRVYGTSGRSDLHESLISAVDRAGGELLFASQHTRAPVYLTVEAGTQAHAETIGLLVYPFRCNPPPIKGRAADEHRVQIRYGSEASWGEDHPVGQDPAGADVTLVLGVHLGAGLFIGLDPLLYDPLPMGISVEFKDTVVKLTSKSSWQVWERENFAGRRRGVARGPQGIETLVAFTPDRLLDYARFEREATRLQLDSPLRFRAASVAAEGMGSAEEARHALEEEFQLSSRDILDIVSKRLRLQVAMRGGVAEHHLEQVLNEDRDVAEVISIDKDAPPDFEVILRDGRRITVECKNISTQAYADGTRRVEVQKTRASKGDPASRFYKRNQFDVVGACLFAATGRWEFRFKAAKALKRHEQFPDRIAALQRVDDSWAPTLVEAVGA